MNDELFSKLENKYKSGIVQRLKISEEKAMEILKEAYQRLQVFKGLNEQEKEIRFERIMTNMCIKKLNSKSDTFRGLILFMGDVRRDNESYINKKLEEYKDPIKQKQLLENGEIKIIDDEPVVFDMREKFPSGKKNWRYGKPLQIQLRRTVSGIVQAGEKDGKPIFKKMNLTISEEDTKQNIIIGKECDFKAIRGSDNEDGTMNLYLESGTEIKYGNTEVPIVQVVKKYYQDRFVNIKELKKKYLDTDEKVRNFTLFIFEAELVTDNSQAPNPNLKVGAPFSFNELLKTPDEELTSIYVKLPTDIALNFNAAPNSTILIAGTCWNIVDDKGEREDFFGVTAKGIFYNEKKIETKKIEPQPTSQNEGDEEW